jgi:type I restriction enzyme S subunit
MTIIPKSWSVVPIVDVLAPNQNGKPFQQGWSPQCESHPAPDDDWGVLKTTAIQPGLFWDHANKQLPKGMEPRPHIEVKAGDLLMTCAGPRSRCGVVCLVERTRSKLMMSGKMYRFRTKSHVMDARFLTYFIQSRDAQLAIDRMKTGISDSGLNLTHDRFSELAVPLAPLAEQKRVVSKIDELFSQLEFSVESIKISKNKLKLYKDSLLEKRLFSTKNFIFLPEVLKVPMSNGYSGKPVKHETAFRVLSLSSTTSGVFDPKHFKFLDESGLEKRDIWCELGDVLVQRGNTPEYVGVPAIYTGEARAFIFPDLMIRLRSDPSKMLPSYLYYAMLSPRIRGFLRNKAKGSAGTMPKINQSILQSVQIPYRQIHEQNEIVRFLDQEFSRITEIEKSIDDQIVK